MVSLLMYLFKKREEKEIINNTRQLLATLGNEELEVLYYDKEKELEDNLEKMNQVQAVIIDVTQKKGIKIAKGIRERYPNIEIMVVADTSISPIHYLNPSIRASALLLRPLENEIVAETIKAFIRQFLKQKDVNEAENMFKLKKRGESVAIPCNNILYFEAKEKKLFVRCTAKEYIIYEALETVQELVPDYFMRCHRSFLVNRLHIENIKYADGIIVLDSGDEVPLSRGYKASVRGGMKSE